MFAVADMIVIHFAFGSPFGVYQLARGGSIRSPRSAANVALHFALWPIFALAFFQRWLGEYTRPSVITFEDKIATLRSKIEEIVFSTRSPVSVLEFREVFTRFTDLAMALNQGKLANPSRELLKASGNTHYATASSCIDRRNRQRMQFHLQQTRNEFFALLSLSSDPLSRNLSIDLLVQLEHLLDDQKTVGEKPRSGLFQNHSSLISFGADRKSCS